MCFRRQLLRKMWPIHLAFLLFIVCRVFLSFVLLLLLLSGILQPLRVWVSSFLRFRDHTQRHTTVGRTSLDEWSARRRDLYLTTHTTQQTNIHAPSGIRTRSPSRRTSTDLRLRSLGTGIGFCYLLLCVILSYFANDWFDCDHVNLPDTVLTQTPALYTCSLAILV
jgi:hypothetical protein